MKNKYVLLCFFYILALCNLTYANTYFISYGGNNKNSGTKTSPWKNLNYAVNQSKDNDTIIVQSGNYNITEKIKIYNKNGITIKGESPYSPHLIFTGTKDEYAIGIGDNSQKIIISNLKISWKSITKGNILGLGGKEVSVKNCILYFDSASKADKYDCIKILTTASNVLIENCEIYGAPQQGIDAVGASNITIRNNKIYNCQNAIVLKGGTINSLIEKNFVFNFRYGAIGLGGTTGAQWNSENFEIADSIVRENVIYYDDANNIGGGIFLIGAIRCKIYNNTIYGPGIHIKNGGTPDKLQFYSKDNIIANNIVWRTGNDGIFVIEPGNEQGLELLNNCYWETTGSGEFKINGKWLNYNDFIKQNLSKNSLFADPLFENISKHNFSLKTNSPCLKKSFIKIDSLPGINYRGAIKPAINKPILTPPNHVRLKQP